jgi:DNA invertase Pin-like site-specific DNA recombinase/transposase
MPTDQTDLPLVIFQNPVVRTLLAAQVNAPRKAEQEASSEGLIGSYTRFSTDKQKQTSTERQLYRNDHLSKKKFGRSPDLAFSDIGESGASIENRPELLKLLDLCEQHVVRRVLIEHYDRWSREVYDGVPLAEKLEKWGVELWSWADQRQLSKADQVDKASRAEEDRKRRTSLLSSGIDQLVEDGGVPFKLPLGYVRSQKSGRPNICEVGKPTVERMFELLVDHSDPETALKLAQERFLTKRGDTDWGKDMVRRMRRNTLYIGMIVWRKTDQTKERNNKKKNFKPRNIDEVIIGRNEKLRIVSDELFNAVNEARSLGDKRNGKKGGARKSVSLLPTAVCDCPGVEGQCLYFDRRYGGRFMCSLEKSRRACQSEHPAEFAFADAEKELVTLLVEGLTPALDDIKYRTGLQARLSVKAAQLLERKAALQSQRDQADRHAEKLTDQAVDDPAPHRLKARREAAEKRVAQLDEDIAALPAIDRLEIGEASGLNELRDALELLKSRIPFVPTSENDRELVKIIRQITRKVVIQRSGRTSGEVGLRLELQPEALYLTPDQMAVCDLPVTLVEKEVSIRRREWGAATRKELEELARSGIFALTDEQWGHVAPFLNFHDEWNGGFSTRQVTDMVLFRMRTGVSFEKLPSNFGDPVSTRNAARRFVYGRGPEILISVLGNEDPSFLNGLRLDVIQKRKKRKASAGLDGVPLHPRLAAAVCAERADLRTSDVQWAAIETALRRSRAPSAIGGLSMRTIIDGVLIKLRTGCAWPQLPAEFGKGYTLYWAMRNLCLLNLWEPVRDLLNSKFPDLMAGLKTEDVDGWKEGHHARKAQWRVNRARIEKVRNNVTLNIARQLHEAGARPIHDRIWVPVKVGEKVLKLRPKLVTGSPSATIDRCCKAPVFVVEALCHGKARHEENVRRFRTMKSVRQVLMIASKRPEIQSHVRTQKGWRVKSFTHEADKIDFVDFGVSMTVGEIYAGSDPNTERLPHRLARTRVAASRGGSGAEAGCSVGD